MEEPRPEVKEMVEEPAEAKQQLANKNGKKAEAGTGGSFFTWFMVLALLGVWTSVAVVWFDLVDYQGVVGKLGSYDADNDGDFDLDDVQVILDIDADIDTSIPETFSNLSEEATGLLYGFFTVVYDIMTPFEIDEDDEEEGSVATKDIAEEQAVTKTVKAKEEKPAKVAEKPRPRGGSLFPDPAGKLKEALKRQLAMIHERVEAKKIARLALAELRKVVAVEQEERKAERAAAARLEEASVRAAERTEAKLRKVMEKMEMEEMEEMEKAEEEMKVKAMRAEEGVEKESEKEKEEEGSIEKRAKREKPAKDKKAPSKKRHGHDDDDKTSKKEGKRSKDVVAKRKRKSQKDSGKEGKK